MSKKKSRDNSKNQNTSTLTYHYNKLGTVTIDEIIQAIITDLRILQEEHNIQHIKNMRLNLQPLNARGESTRIRNDDGHPVRHTSTDYFRSSWPDPLL